MNGLKSYMVRLGSLELATVIFWMLFWLANGLAKLIPGVNIGVKFAEKGDVNSSPSRWARWAGARVSETLPSTSQASLNCSSGSSSRGH